MIIIQNNIYNLFTFYLLRIYFSIKNDRFCYVFVTYFIIFITLLTLYFVFLT
nr:MAG TPA: hypothetical protein [Bacteriophage sp.]DAK47123.1 MAG TPA: hypothetical protein [Caudoviricetes sp.]